MKIPTPYSVSRKFTKTVAGGLRSAVLGTFGFFIGAKDGLVEAFKPKEEEAPFQKVADAINLEEEFKIDA